MTFFSLLLFAIIIVEAENVVAGLNATLFLLWKSTTAPSSASPFHHVEFSITDFKNMQASKCVIVGSGMTTTVHGIESSQLMPSTVSPLVPPGTWSATIRAFASSRNTNCGVKMSGDSAEDTKTISNNAMFNSMKDVEATIVAGMYAVAYQYTWSFDGVRAQDVVQVAAGDNLALQLVASSKTMSLPTKFKSVVNVAAGGKLTLAVDFSSPLAASMEFDNGTFLGDLVLDISQFTPPATAPYVFKLPAAFVARKPGSKYNFASISSLQPLDKFVVANLVQIDAATGDITVTLTALAATDSPTSSTPTASRVPNETMDVTTPTTTATTSGAGGESTTSIKADKPSGLVLFGLSGIVLYALMAGAGCVVLSVIIITIVCCVVCKRRRDNSSAFELGGGEIQMQPSPYRTLGADSFASTPPPPPNALAPPPSSTFGSSSNYPTVGGTSSLPPAIAIDARSPGAYPQPKTMTSGEIEY